MLSSLLVLALALVQVNALLPVHNITRYPGIRFENLAIRPNGQILTTSTGPNASIYQVDPMGILPMTLIYRIPNIASANGIAEGEPDIFYVASGNSTIDSPHTPYPETYAIIAIDVHGVSVLPNGTLTRQPVVKKVASLPAASLMNAIAFASPLSHNPLVADSFRGLIWNVNVSSGAVGVTLNDTTTRSASDTGSTSTGINGIKVHNGTVYWTNTGRNTVYKVPIDEEGNVRVGTTPSVVTSNITCDDLVLDAESNAYIASPFDVLTKVSPSGEQEVIAGMFNSSSSPLIGPTAARFGRMSSDRWSLYVTTNGGLVGAKDLSGAGISRIDLG